MSPIALIIFVSWIEWCITTDIEGETFRHIGQWGAVIAVVLALLAAMITRYHNEVAQWIKNGVTSTRLCKATSMKEIITERPPALDTGDSETEKLATVQIKRHILVALACHVDKWLTCRFRLFRLSF